MNKKIKFVPARKKNADCVIACLAMILNRPYEKVIADFWTDFNKQGLAIEPIIFYLGDCGLSVVRKRAYSFDNIINARKEMWKPFADIHFVKVRQWADRKTTHAVVMDNKGKIYDPGNRIGITKNYYEVVEVIGIFYPN